MTQITYFKVPLHEKFLKYLLVLIILILIAGIVFLFRPIASKQVQTTKDEPVVDAVLVGGGIMSATLGTYFTELEPNWQIRMFERLDQVAQESSNGFNNAGTGHSGFMEMNYTEEKTVRWKLPKLKKLLLSLKLLNSSGHIR